ncbi:CoA transferase [Nitrosovibrio tenuis]|uniref:Crotonobetainyl-CoA:carnitine CoA-transferase CaiB n=1 Tax=Nitrosovibrio tenuis TaxID=1233 RepID=A0A1H7PXV6_9PROT|nr:CoA transferase [Nitrosovibrio tenuis]SEL40670.1 Crotonobetainyl-CoA:carnitine CoA-transferase CaiB [Nitrosovibrio tenuis]
MNIPLDGPLNRPLYRPLDCLPGRPMDRALSGCAIAGQLKSTSPDFASIASSLHYQSTALGMEIETTENGSGSTAFSFGFKTPHTMPVRCNVTRWRNPSRHSPVTENTMQAACGLMSVHGRASGKLQPLGLNYVSTLTAALALQGGIAASIGQLRGLSTLNSNISMGSAGLLSVAQYIAGATASESPETLLPQHTAHATGFPFVSLDGVVFELETLDAGPWRKFWSAIGVSSAAAGKGWSAFLLRYAKAISPVPEELSSAISKFSYHRLSQICTSTGMAICPVRSIDVRAQDEDSKRIWLQGPWEFLFETNFKENLRDGRSSRAIGDLPTGNLPLSGLTVIESCRRIQGPLAGHLLALLGADVIRIEPPGGDPLRGMPPMAEGCSARFDALNRLKTIREIDIKSPAGQAEITDLVRHADIFLHNWAPGKAVLFNLDHEDMVRINPSLIYAYAAGWSTDSAGHASSSSMPGTDFMTQAYSGVARKIAENSGTRGGSLFTVLDVLGGVVAAQGATIALLNRCMNNTGARVTSSLMSAATLLCADDFQNLYNLPGRGAPASKSIIVNIYITKRGKIAVECRDLKTLARLAEILDAVMYTESDFPQCLDSLFLSRTANEWAEIFEQAGIPSAVVIEDLAELQTVAYLQPDLSPGPYTKVNSPWSFT